MACMSQGVPKLVLLYLFTCTCLFKFYFSLLLTAMSCYNPAKLDN